MYFSSDTPYYTLDENKNPVPCTREETGKFYKNRDLKRVARDEIDGYTISTVFLCIDHRFDEDKPVLFETMVFDNNNYGVDVYSKRYHTWQEAEEGHKKAIEWVKAGCKNV